jgi:thioredoxin 1
MLSFTIKLYQKNEEGKVSEDISHVTDETFKEEVIGSQLPVLVDFWAGWCAPCHMVTPALDELVQNYGDKLKVVKVNVDESREVPARYGIMSIPTLLLFKGGEVIETIIGALPKDRIVQAVSQHL